MVLLTMTLSMVEGLNQIQALQPDSRSRGGDANNDNSSETIEISAETKSSIAITITSESGELDIGEPAVAKPISHRQVLELWQALKVLRPDDAPSLETLLVGASVYVPPPPPPPEPSAEFKALMARLRRDEEARAYQRMVRPPEPLAVTTNARAAAFASVNRPIKRTTGYGDDGGIDDEDEDVTMQDVHRQVMLIFNFVLTMAGVAYTLWVLARWWPTPSRLFLSMGGSVLVGLAEYGLYAGYVWHLAQAKRKDKTADSPAAVPEVKQVLRTWVVSGNGDDQAASKEEENSKTGEPARAMDAETKGEPAGAIEADSVILPSVGDSVTSAIEAEAAALRRRKRDPA